MREASRQFLRYVVVQLAAYGLEWGVFLLGRALSAGLIPSNFFAKLSALAFAFVMHRLVTFGTKDKAIVRQGLSYLLLFMFNVVASTSLLWMLERIIPETVAKLLADVLLVFISYFLARTFVFVSPQKPADKPS